MNFTDDSVLRDELLGTEFLGSEGKYAELRAICRCRSLRGFPADVALTMSQLP